ncbi:unnamed protein product, partial [Adineta ricciae]
WRILYHWGELIRFHHDENYALVTMPNDMQQVFFDCMHVCRCYFSSTATQEILDKLRPWLCPFDSAFEDALYFFQIFLPIHLPSDLHEQGFKLWLLEFLGIWESIQRFYPNWEQYFINLFSVVAWHNIGYIDWEPWISQIFTRFLRNLSLPVGNLSTTSLNTPYLSSTIATLIVAMIGNGSSCLEHIKDFFRSIKSFYHLSNTEYFQGNIVEFLTELTNQFLERVCQEKNIEQTWYFQVRASFRLTDKDIDEFVDSLKECVYISIFNKTDLDNAARAFRNLAMLRPEQIIPNLIEQLFLSIDNMIEPHRFTSILYCLTNVTLEIATQKPTYVLPLLIAVLPGIDSNDFDKTSVTLQFLKSMLSLITCVDCSAAVQIRNDLTEIEKEVCLSTSKFEDFLTEFLSRCFQIIDHLSTIESDADTVTNFDENNIVSDLTSVINAIVQQCSDKLFEVLRNKITNFLVVSSMTSKVNNLMTILVRPLLQANSHETLKSLLPQTCERIEKIVDDLKTTIFTDYQGDAELTWYLILFSELLRARGDSLIVYKPMIFSIFQRSVRIIHRESYGAVADAAQYLLRSLSYVYPTEYRITMQSINEPFNNFLPIRSWGQHINVDDVHPQFHIPNQEEITFACEFAETFLYPELALLTEKCSEISKDERLRSLRLISSITTGFLRMVPKINDEEVADRTSTSSMISLESKYKLPLITYAGEPKFQENLRRRLAIDIGNLLDELVDKHPDDTASISLALQVYSLPSCYYGFLANECERISDELSSSIYSYESEIKNKRSYPRFILIQCIDEQLDLFSLFYSEPFTEMDKQVVNKVVELSMNRYSDIRANAQQSLFVLLNRYHLSYELIVNRLLELLNASEEVNHDEFKGCLYILLGTDSFFLPEKRSWPLLEKLWPAIAYTEHATRASTQDLIMQIRQKIFERFNAPAIIEETNPRALRAAINLWRELESEEMKISNENRAKSNEENVQSYTNLMKVLSFTSNDIHLTWHQQKTMINFIAMLLQKRVPLPTSCIQTGMDLFIHDNIELRFMAASFLSTVCRLQKPPRIYVEKTREEIIGQVINDEIHPGDRKDNLCMTIDDYKPAKTQAEWEESCFLDKSFYGYYQWPKVIKYSLNKRERYTKENMPEQVTIVYDRFMDKTFVEQAIQFMVSDLEEGNGFDIFRYRMFKGLFRNFGSAFIDNFMEILESLVHEKVTEKQEASAQIAAEIVAGMIRGSKYWTKEMHDRLWFKLTPFLTTVCTNLSSEVVNSWYNCFHQALGDMDPRRMYRAIEFLLFLIKSSSTTNTIGETSRWTLIKSLRTFEWRIPKVWHTVNVYAKDLLEHPVNVVRERVISILATSFSHDVTLANGQSTRSPKIDVFLNEIRKRLQEVIRTYERASIDRSDEVEEIDAQNQKALAFIESVIGFYIKILDRCLQPIQRGMIELFPQLCDLENIVAHDENLQARLSLSRTSITTLHLQIPFLEAFIDQIEYTCKSNKWHTRRSALEFAQYLIFNNLFNARSFAARIRKLVFQHLSDEQLEVRSVASITLAGFYQCSLIPITKKDREYFHRMSKTNYLTKVDGEKITSTQNIIKRHGGVLGLCAMVLSSPYDIPEHVPDALMDLCEHLHDPILIRESVKYALSEFRRTHHNSWHEHRAKFTEDQLIILTDVLISPSYYA